MTQEVMQPWVHTPPRLVVTSFMCSPPTCSASAKRPSLKLRVGSPPASLRMLIRMSVP